MPTPRRIAAVSVNHNTSRYMELMLRSLVATHADPDALGLAVTVLGKQSEDDTAPLRAYAGRIGVPVLPPGFDTHSKHNSHGEVPRRFLFLVADTVFVEADTLGTMVGEPDGAPADVFAVGPRIAFVHNRQEVDDRAHLYGRRLHPLCALFRNTPVLRRVAERVGFSCARYLWAEREQYLDTNELMTLVMRTHGLRSLRSAAVVLHFFGASYHLYGPDYLRNKAVQRDRLLTELRRRDPDPPNTPPA
jgi:hypothetical protein